VLEPESYAELLGLYLGDGHITRMARSDRLRLFLDAKYPEVVDESEALLRAVFPDNRVGRTLAGARADGRPVGLLSASQVPLPAAWDGKKHERSIALETWQQDLVDRAPWAFLRGCIRSDGCVFLNRTGPYEYLSHDFANLSQDILDLFVATCHHVGLRPRRYTKRCRMYRRADVAAVLERVGLKA